MTTMVNSVWSRLAPFLGGDKIRSAELARRLGVSQQAADKFRAGGGLSVENHLKMSKEFGLNPWWLLNGDEPKLLRDLVGGSVTTMEPAHPSIKYLTERIAERLEPLDATDRRTASNILHDMAIAPQDGVKMGEKMARLLGESQSERGATHKDGTDG